MTPSLRKLPNPKEAAPAAARAISLYATLGVGENLGQGKPAPPAGLLRTLLASNFIRLT
jgi:hypothetical protein